MEMAEGVVVTAGRADSWIHGGRWFEARIIAAGMTDGAGSRIAGVGIGVGHCTSDR